MGEIIVKINKPLYGTFAYVNNDKINLAKARKWNLKIVLPQGEAVYTPAEWLKNAKYLEKVFLYPDNPMKMWGRNVEIGHQPRGKKKQDPYEKYNRMSDEEKFYNIH